MFRLSTLRRRIALHTAAMIAASLLIAAASIAGIVGLHQDLGAAMRGFQENRQVYEIGVHVENARTFLEAPTPDQPDADAQIKAAALFAELSPAGLEKTRALLAAAAAAQSPIADQLARVNDVLAELAAVSANIRQAIAAGQAGAQAKLYWTVSVVGALSILIVAGAIIAGTRHYRAVIDPVDRLTDAVRRFASGKFAQRIAPTGDREFALLARDFNQMADQLEALYHDLEAKVAAASRELARSERLASVGFLAAGVAHEINNPLSIIAGYAERTLGMLERGHDPSQSARAKKAVRIICEEAFRCKTITDRLLSLSRPGGSERTPCDAAMVIAQVVRNVTTLPAYQKRTVNVQADGPAIVLAKEGELKQVLMNLTVNALDATDPAGRVDISIRRADESVTIVVADNGAGMTEQVRQRVFEPFYTTKRGRAPGVGLGLSISHAIVIEHGGAITAESDGPGSGSRFTMVFAAAEGAALATH